MNSVSLLLLSSFETTLNQIIGQGLQVGPNSGERQKVQANEFFLVNHFTISCVSISYPFIPVVQSYSFSLDGNASQFCSQFLNQQSNSGYHLIKSVYHAWVSILTSFKTLDFSFPITFIHISYYYDASLGLLTPLLQ